MKKFYLFFFLTLVMGAAYGQVCNTFMSTDVPKAIPPSGTSGTTYSVLVTTGGTIEDVNVVDLVGTHTWLADLNFYLTSPQGTQVTLISQTCGSMNNFNLSLDESGTVGLPCPYTDGGTYATQNNDGTSLDDFNGEDSEGTWTLTIYDDAGGDVGQLNSWGLEICVEGCPANRVVSTDPGKCGAVVSYATPSAAGATATQIDDSGLTSGDEFPLGVTMQEWEMEYTDGTLDTCSFSVTVTEDEAPVLSCSPIEIDLRPNGQYVLRQSDVESMIDVLADNCTPLGDIDVQVTPRSFDCAQAGQDVPVTITVTDISGNVSTCQTEVTVNDTIAPVAKCKDINISLDANGAARIFPAQVNGGSYDECAIYGMALDTSNFDCSDLGENVVELSVNDKSGNIGVCTATVTVTDTLAPVFTEIEDVEVILEQGLCESKIDYPEVIVAESCGATLEQTNGLGPDGVFPVGATAETWVATDSSGNSSELTFNIIVIPTIMPEMDSIVDVEVSEDTTSINVPLSGIATGTGCESQEITLSAEHNNDDLISALTLNYTAGDSIGALDIELVAGQTGAANVIVKVEGSNGDTLQRDFTLTVLPVVNSAPYVVQPIPDQTVNADEVLEVVLSSIPGVLFDDDDDEEFTISAALEGTDTLPTWATYSNDTLLLEPTMADTGCVNIVVIAADTSGATVSDTFEVCVDGEPLAIEDFETGLTQAKMYPNPTDGLVTMTLPSFVSGDIELTVSNIAGKIVLRKSFSGLGQIQFNMADKVSGMYFVSLRFGQNRDIRKLIVK